MGLGQHRKSNSCIPLKNAIVVHNWNHPPIIKGISNIEGPHKIGA